MKVLSLFDGISCGQVALERANIPVEKYYASEIDKYAIAVTQYRYPDTIQLGNVVEWHNWDIDWSSIDLLIGGSPCTQLSVAGNGQGLEGKDSKLFYQYAEILNHLKKHNPNVKFLLENVKMKKEFEDQITNILGVQPILVNSALVSAQNRKRLYWANWNITQPEDKHILLKDIVHEYSEVDRNKSLCLLSGYDSKFQPKRYFEKRIHQAVFEPLSEYIVPFNQTLKILDKEVERGKMGYYGKDSQANRVYYIHDKAVTLCGSAGGGVAKMGLYLFGCITPDRINKRQNGQRFSEGNKFYTLTARDKHGVLIEGYIRKLTPIECERLQTLPDNYTNIPTNSKTQRYKQLGNGWTVDVIAHILRGLKQ